MMGLAERHLLPQLSSRPVTKARRLLKVALVRAAGNGWPWFLVSFLFRLFRLRHL